MDNGGSPPPTDTSDAEPRPPSGRQAVLVLAVVLIAILVSQTVLRRDRPGEPPNAPPPIAPAAGVVSLAIDSGEGLPRESPVPWNPGLTVLEALEGAPLGWPGPVERTGEAGNAFVHGIGGVTNEGVDGRNWQYYVNGELGGVGAGVREVAEGDRVLWRFAAEE